MPSPHPESFPLLPTAISGHHTGQPSTSSLGQQTDDAPTDPEGPMDANSRNTNAKNCRCVPLNTSTRNLVVCIDGTANQFSTRNTHVVELYSRLYKDDKQLTYYDSGIGTFVKDSNWFGRLKQSIAHNWDMAVAWNLKRIILCAYQWLSENYQPGDRIYLFGFSRGAYQVRIIAGMIHMVGLLHKGNNNQIPFAYELYLATTEAQKHRRPANEPQVANADEEEEDERKMKDPITMCRRFKQTLSWEDATVHLAGVWDTVSSVGVTRGPTLPETTTGMEHVCTFRHALALDECRVKFLPEYANGGAGPAAKPDSGEHTSTENGADTRVRGDVKEVWFVGSHSDIGGGNAPNLKLNKFGPPLRWMVDEASLHGLRVKPSRDDLWVGPTVNSSMSFGWKLLEIIPIRRLSYTTMDGTKRWVPHNSGGRHIREGQRIHSSVIKFMQHNHDYTPKASFRGIPFSWKSAQAGLHVDDPHWAYVEDEPYGNIAAACLLEFIDVVEGRSGQVSSPTVVAFKELTSTVNKCRQFIMGYPDASNILLRILEHVGSSPRVTLEATQDLILALVEALAAFDVRPRETSWWDPVRLPALLMDIVGDTHRRKIHRTFCIWSLSASLKGHFTSTLSVMFSPDGKLILSTGNNGIIRLWNADTGLIVHVLTGGITGVWGLCSTFSSDGTLVFSGDRDGKIRVFTVATGKPEPGPAMYGHTSWVASIAFASNGKYIASGSYDRTVWLWSATTWKPLREPLVGHTGTVHSVAISPDSTLIASASNDRTVRIWTVAIRGAVESRILTGHSHPVYSVAFSPDGKWIVSGSGDHTIRIWDAQTGQLVRDPLRGHTKGVRSLAFSPDGKYIVSGSDDKTMRLWRTDTGEAIGDAPRKNMGTVYSVAFSSDGRRIVSGSGDWTIRVWA